MIQETAKGTETLGHEGGQYAHIYNRNLGANVSVERVRTVHCKEMPRKYLGGLEEASMEEWSFP